MGDIFKYRKNGTEELFLAAEVTNDNLERVARWSDGLIVDYLVRGKVWLGIRNKRGLHYVPFGDYILEDSKKELHHVVKDDFVNNYTIHHPNRSTNA